MLKAVLELDVRVKGSLSLKEQQVGWSVPSVVEEYRAGAGTVDVFVADQQAREDGALLLRRRIPPCTRFPSLLACGWQSGFCDCRDYDDGVLELASRESPCNYPTAPLLLQHS